MVYLNNNGTLKAMQASAIGNTILYTGRRLDTETGLYYFRARYYDSTLGRFVGRDPIGYEGSEWNLFGFVDGRSLTFVDPIGFEGIRVGTLPTAPGSMAECEEWKKIHLVSCEELSWYSWEHRKDCIRSVQEQFEECYFRTNMDKLASDLWTGCPGLNESDIALIIESIKKSRQQIQNAGGAVHWSYWVSKDIHDMSGLNCHECSDVVCQNRVMVGGFFWIGNEHGPKPPTHQWIEIQNEKCGCAFIIDLWEREYGPYMPEGNGWNPGNGLIPRDRFPWFFRLGLD